MTQKVIRFGLVGAGAIAATHMDAIEKYAGTTLVAVADANPETSKEVSEARGATGYTSHRDMIKAGGIDAVIVCTPPITHRDICLDFFEAGIHVLCEKPLSIDSPSAREMLSAADAAGVKFTMASKFRYVEDTTKARNMVRDGLIGELLVFENCFASPVDMSSRWNANPAVSGGGVLIDNGTHSIDIVHYLLGPISELEVIEGKRYQKLPVEDTVTMVLRAQSGVVGRVDLSWSHQLQRRGFVNLVGSEGVIVVGWQASAYCTDGKTWMKFGDGYDKVQSFVNQIDNFVKAIYDEEELLITSDDALASVEVIEAAYEALHGKKWQKINYDDAAHKAGTVGYGVEAAG